MVISCSAYGCKNTQNVRDYAGNKFSFHRFPADKSLCLAWLVAVKRVDFVPTRFSYLCSAHFTDDQYKIVPTGYRLRPNAVPTVFPTVPKARKKVTGRPSNFCQVKPPIKIAPKRTFDVTPTVKILPKPVLDNHIPIYSSDPVTNIPESSDPVLTYTEPSEPQSIVYEYSSIGQTIISSNLIEAALRAYTQSDSKAMSQNQVQHNGAPASVFVVHPQANGSNLVTIPTISGNPSQNAGYGTPVQVGTGDRYQQVRNKARVEVLEEKIKKYRKTIKTLAFQHRRQQDKIDYLKGIIHDLKSSELLDSDDSEENDVEGDVSEDMSEDEIYTEMLIHQIKTKEHSSESDSTSSDDEK